MSSLNENGSNMKRRPGVARFFAITRLFAAPLLAILLLAAPAGAHDNWLEVEPFTAPKPGRAKVYLLTGEHLAEAAALHVRGRDRYTAFRLLTAAGARDLLPLLREDQDPLATLDTVPSGTSLVTLEAAPRAIQLEAAKFEEYLLEERLVDVLYMRAATDTEDEPGRERYSRSLKAIVQIGPDLDPLATRPVGAALEIVPLAHPHGLAPGDRLTVQVLFKGKPLVGRAVMAANRFRKNVTTRTRRTNADGKVSFVVGRGGDWMFRLVHMERSAEPDVDWRSYWANLTFSLPETLASSPPVAPRQ